MRRYIHFDILCLITGNLWLIVSWYRKSRCCTRDPLQLLELHGHQVVVLCCARIYKYIRGGGAGRDFVAGFREGSRRISHDGGKSRESGWDPVEERRG